jgi:serine protease AprX
MDIEIPRDLIEFILLGGGDSRRYIQDSPILVDVWAKFAQQPYKPADLLITAHMESTASDLAADIYDAIERPAGWEHDPDVAPLQSLVAARLYFGEVLTILMPMTSWWRDEDIQEEARKYAADSPLLAETVTEVGNLLERWSADSARTEKNDWTDFKRFVALCALVSIVGLSPWHGATTTGEAVTVLKATNTDTIPDDVRGLLQKMAPKGEPKVWQISLNRTAQAAIAQSVPTVKADAARRLFEVDCRNINWAVVDTGIDKGHPAFADRVKKTYDFTNYRQIASIGNKTADVRKANLKIIEDARETPLPEAADETLRVVAEALHSKRPIPWDLVAELVELEKPPKPSSGHGTHVAGIIGATKYDDRKSVEGMCPGIGLYDFRILKSDAIGVDEFANTEFQIIAALQFIRHYNAQADKIRIHGVNMSLSIPHNVLNHACGRTPICKESEKLVDSGVVVVVAAGNRGIDGPPTAGRFAAYAACSITDPGNAERVITVGSTHPYAPFTHGVSYFSSRGPTGDGRLKPDLVAPGQEITAPSPGGNWDRLDGTSQAAPHVSGAAAMLMARYSELIGDPERIKRILCETATDLGRERTFQGHGLLDVLRALQSQ